ncbi:MAG: molybdenum cofactor guanylyltransferase [Candidatus Aminicenantes bacterium]|nr:MAG: molybdenum cofactor guanylyltransferase [Candidatus Aminicenantes bacterium]
MMDKSCIILAGGKSSRMARDKAFVTVGGESLLQRVINAVDPIAGNTIVVAAKGQTLPLPSGRQNMKVVADIFPNKGVLGGLYTGLAASKSFYNLVVACDMPFLNQNFLRPLLQIANGYDAVIPRLGNMIEPLHAVYTKDCLGILAGLFEHDNLKVRDAFPLLRVRYLGAAEIEGLDPRRLSLFNVNTEFDLEKAREMEKYLA